VPDQINAESFDGQLCLHGPEEWHIQSFRTGMAQFILPRPGDYYVFPAWQPHSVAPFRGEGDRWSIAFNVVAVPAAGRPAAPAPLRGSEGPGAPPPLIPQQSNNVYLTHVRPRPGGFG
jgi:hypothetical protein